MRRTIYMILVLVGSIQGLGQSLEQKYDSLMSKVFEKDVPGGVALVSAGGEILYRKAFGMANLELGVKMDPDHVFRIGSNTKQFTAIAILKLYEEGKLNLQDEITKYIPDYPTRGRKITIEHLLTHTSGIKSYTGMKDWTPELRKIHHTPEQIIDFFKYERFDFKPGVKFKYNNSGYILLGYIIEIVSGKTYEQYITENIFKPLGMGSSHYDSDSMNIMNKATGYRKEGEEYKPADYVDMSNPYAAGALVSNVDDIFKWYRALMQYQVVSEPVLNLAHKPYKLRNGESTSYGYGWFVSKCDGAAAIEHSGGINGFLSYVIYLPDEEILVVMLSNCTSSTHQGIAGIAREIATITRCDIVNQ